MGLKNIIDKQVYTRTREPLGQTLSPNANSLAFNNNYNANPGKKYSLPIQWIQKAYLFPRFDSYGVKLTIDQFLQYSGHISSYPVPVNTEGISAFTVSGMNTIFASHVYSVSGFSADLSFTSDANVSIAVSVFYDGEWKNTATDFGKELTTTISVPPGKSCIIAVAFYAYGWTKYNITTQFSQASDVAFYNSLPIDTPVINSISAHKDTQTRNLSVDISYNAPTNKLSWTGTRLLRKTIEAANYATYRATDAMIGNGLYLNTTGLAATYITGQSLDYSSAKYTVQNSVDVPGNRLSNGDFNEATAHWKFSHTSSGSVGYARRSTAYGTKQYPYNGDKCLYVTMSAITNNVASTRTCWIEHTTNAWYAVSQSSAYNFTMHHYVQTATTKSVKFYFSYDGGTNLCATSSAVALVKFHSTWMRTDIPVRHIRQTDIYGRGIIMPPRCTHVKPRIYLATANKTAGSYWLDCLGFYATSNQYMYNASSNPLTFVGLTTRITQPKNNSTYDIWPGHTTVGINGKTLSPTGVARLVSTSLTGRFGRGFGAVEGTTNYIKGGDFQDTTKHTYTRNIQFVSTSDTMYSRRAVYFPVVASSLTLSTSRSISANIGGNTAWCMSVWAKAAAGAANPQLVMHIGDTGGIAMTSTVTVGPTWNRYYFARRAGAAARNSSQTLVTKLIVPTAYAGGIYVSGWQCENKTYPTMFAALNTAGGSVSNAYYYVTAAEATKIIQSTYGTITFNVYNHNSFVSSATTNTYLSYTDEAGTNNIFKIYYDYYARKLVLRSGANYLYHTCTFVAREPLTIGLSWDTSKLYFYYNGYVKSTAKPGSMPYSGKHLRFGFSQEGGAAIRGNCAFNNVRIDTAQFTQTQIEKIAQSVKFEPVTYKATNLLTDEYLSIDIPRTKNDATLLYSDTKDIINGSQYEYKMQFIDGDIAGPESLPKRYTVNLTPPSAVISTSAVSGASWIDYKWKTGDAANTHHYLVYMNNDKNYTNAFYGPYLVLANPDVATAQFSFWDVYDTSPRSVWVLPFDAWDNATTANAVKVTGIANELYWARNLIINPSFEYQNPRDNKHLVAWSTAGNTTTYTYGSRNSQTATSPGRWSTAYYFTGGLGGTTAADAGGRSIIGGTDEAFNLYVPWQDIVWGFNSANPQRFRYSYWTHTLSLRSTAYSGLSYMAFSAMDGFGREVTKDIMGMRLIDTKTGADGRTWKRYATAFSYSRSWTSGYNIPVKIRIAPYSIDGFAGGNVMAYVDAIQLEVSSGDFTAYTPSRYSLNASLAGVVQGEVPTGSLNITNFPNNTLTIATDTGAGGRIIVGKENNTNVFQEFSASRSRLHPANTATSFGFNFAKHIEAGSGVFGVQYPFNNRYTTWSGAAISPFMFIAPKDCVTYATSSGITGNQKVAFNYTATPGGFIANATLYTSGGRPIEKTVTTYATGYPYGGHSARGKNYAESQNYTTDYSQWLATSFGKKSKSNTGYIKYNASGINLGSGKQNENLDDAQAKVYFWCTAGNASGSVQFVSTSSWRYLGYQWVNLQWVTNQYTFNISTAAWSRATALCMFATSISDNVRGRIDLTSYGLSTALTTVYKTDSAVGTFYWMATDGGQI